MVPIVPPPAFASSPKVAQPDIETQSEITEPDSVLHKKHDISLVEDDNLAELINLKLQKLHFQQIYEGNYCEDADDDCENYSFEIEALNQFEVAKGSTVKPSEMEFVHLPDKNCDYYVEG